MFTVKILFWADYTTPNVFVIKSGLPNYLKILGEIFLYFTSSSEMPRRIFAIYCHFGGSLIKASCSMA